VGYDSKYGKVTTEHGDIPDDEPVVVLRGRDLAVPRTMAFYKRACRDLGSPPEHLGLAQDTANYIKGWQRFHTDRVQVATSARYFDRIQGEQEETP
jgi:hypothetical protein